jgi:hypothetical protein
MFIELHGTTQLSRLLFRLTANVTAKVFSRPAVCRMLGHEGKSSFGV